MESTIYLLKEWTLKAGGHSKVDSMFLIKKGACAAVEDFPLHLERNFGHAPEKCCYCHCGHVEADSGYKSSTLFLSWHNPVYGSSAHGILVQLGDLEGKPILGRVGDFQCQILVDLLLQQLTS